MSRIIDPNLPMLPTYNLTNLSWVKFLPGNAVYIKSTKSSITTTLKRFKIKIKAEQLLLKQLSKFALLSTFSIFSAY